MKKILYILLGAIIAIPSIAWGINITIPQATQYGQIPRGNANGTYTPVASTTLGLAVSSFASPNISQWTNNSGYITASSTQQTVSGTLWLGNGAVNSPSLNIGGTGLYLNGAGVLGFTNGTSGYSWNGTMLYPNTTLTRDLGGVSNYWNNAYIGNITTSNLPSFPLTKGNFLVGNDAGVAQATSSIYVSSLGKIGIGTSTPYAKLTVWGSGNTTNTVFEAVDNASTTLMNILGNGNVNIGGTNLTYNGTTGVTAISSAYIGTQSFETDSGVNQWIDLPVTSSSALGTVNSYSARIDGFDMLTITSDSLGTGDVWHKAIGFGTTTPSAMYHFASATSTTSTYPLFNLTDINGNSFLFSKQNGNIGIGTTTPGQKLSVAGFVDAQSGYKIDGTNALYASTTNFSVSVGSSAPWMQATSTGFYSTALGYQALNTTPLNGSTRFNTAIGYKSLTANDTGYFNTGIGSYSLLGNTSGVYNTGLGMDTLYTNSTGSYNTASGVYSSYFNTMGSGNSSYGTYSLYKNTTASSSSAFGYQALRNQTTGESNTAVGYNAGYGDGATQDQNSVIDKYMTFLGYQSSRDASVASTTILTNGTAIGKNARVGCSNCLVLGGTGDDAVNVGIGTTTPTNKLEVNGAVWATSFIDDGVTISAPDYVFEKGYKILSLLNVKDFVTKNTHLPWLTPRGSGAMSLSTRINEVLEGLENLWIQVFKLDTRTTALEKALKVEQAKTSSQQKQIDALIKEVNKLKN